MRVDRKTWYFVCPSCGDFLVDGQEAELERREYVCRGCGRFVLELTDDIKVFD